MTKVEIETIVEADRRKNEILEQAFDKMMKAWSLIDMDKKQIFVTEYNDMNVYLKGKSDQLWYSFFDQYDELKYDYLTPGGTHVCDYKDDLTFEIMKEAIDLIPGAISRHFKKIQKRIDKKSELWNQMNRITECLSR